MKINIPCGKYRAPLVALSIALFFLVVHALPVRAATHTVTHTTQADFNAGENSSTQVNGLGNGSVTQLVQGSQQISANTLHSCALKNDGSSFCWGVNWNGQLGDNTWNDLLTPVQIEGIGGLGYFTGVNQISAGGGHTCVIVSGGRVYCWGGNESGELGNNTLDNSFVPTQVLDVGGIGNLADVVQVAAAENHTCALKADGTVYCWGANWNGQLGDNTTIDSLVPVQVLDVGGSANLTDVASISAGNGYSTCAIKTNGTLYCWGYNGNSQLGNGTLVDSPVPVQVLGVGGVGNLTGVNHVEVGRFFSCATKTDGTAYCWGSNDNGELGNNTVIGSATPVQVAGVGGVGTLTNVTRIIVGEAHACAVKIDGTAYCWGRNNYGQLGNNTTAVSYTPVQVFDEGGSGNLSDIADIKAGYGYSCALKNDGTVLCWGRSEFHSVGDGTTTDRHVPVRVLDVGGLHVFGY